MLADPDEWMILPGQAVWRVAPEDAPDIASALADRGLVPADDPEALARALATGELVLVRRDRARPLDAPGSLRLRRLRDLALGEVTGA